jgi:hypothetical protein
MSFLYKKYTLNSYLDEPWYAKEIALFEAILDKLPDYDKTYVSTQHYHSRIGAPTAGTTVISVDDSNNAIFSQLGAGVALIDSSHIMGVTGCVNDFLAAGIDATLIGAGTVSNTEFGYVNGVTSSIQDQLDALTPFVPVSAAQVTYTHTAHPSFTSVQDALDNLFYVAATISAFTNNAGTVYKGSTVTGFIASWTIVGTITAQTLTGKTPALSDRTATYSGLTLTVDTTYTLTIDDAVSSPVDTETTTIYFRLRKYYGSSVSSTPNEAAIEAGSVTASINTAASRALGSTSITGGGNYPFYAYPASWGSVSLTVNGFASVWNETTVSVTSAEGNTENYKVYTSPNQVVGAILLIATAA